MFFKKYPAKNYWQAGLIIVLLGLYSFFLFHHLGRRAFIDWDESIYAQVSKETLLHHNFSSLTLYGSHWFEKPPLMIWLTALGFKIFGINELGGRFFVALLALATIILTFFLVKKITQSFLASFLALLAYGVCYHFFFHSYFLEFDIPAGFFILLSLFCFLLALEKPKYFYGLFAALAFGTLAKSVIGLLPVLIVFFYSLLTRNFSYLKNKQFYRGLGLYALLVLPWHLWETLKFGRAFWNSYLFYHVIERYISPLENNGGPFNYYLPIFLQNKVFGILILISSLYFLLKSRKNKNYLFLLLSSVIIFLFFSLAQTKGFGYIVVIYPCLLAMIGISLYDLLNFCPWQNLKITAIVILAAVFLGLGWQENNFKILRLENDQYYEENKTIARFINSNYPGKAVYGASWVEANLAFSYYLGKPVSNLPKEQVPPSDYNTLAKSRVFHQMKRSVYNFPTYLYIAP